MTSPLTLQPDETTGLDTFIAGATGITGYNYGIHALICAGSSGALASPYRGLLQFDISGVPADQQIDSATLTLYCVSEGTAADYDVAVHRALTQWYEGAKNGAAPDVGQDGSTWLLRNANGAVAWAGGAGGASGSDWTAGATDTVTITATGTAYDWDVTVDVAAWYAGTSNYGWWVIGSEASTNHNKNFASATNGTAGLRPKLVINYSALPGAGGQVLAYGKYW